MLNKYFWLGLVSIIVGVDMLLALHTLFLALDAFFGPGPIDPSLDNTILMAITFPSFFLMHFITPIGLLILGPILTVVGFILLVKGLKRNKIKNNDQ